MPDDIKTSVVMSPEERLAYSLREVRLLRKQRDDALRRIDALENLLSASAILAYVAERSEDDQTILTLLEVGIKAMKEEVCK